MVKEKQIYQRKVVVFEVEIRNMNDWEQIGDVQVDNCEVRIDNVNHNYYYSVENEVVKVIILVD